MLNLLSLAGLSLLAALPQAYAGNLVAHNNCPFSIYCASAKNDATFSPTVEVVSGATYLSPQPAFNDNVGVVVKCALDPSLYPVYQMELAVQYGISWLDISHEDGDPFLQYHRHAEIRGVSRLLFFPSPTRVTRRLDSPSFVMLDLVWGYAG
ncbi:hypothetical protein F5Y10DRAFT_260743 [Nemania abortiva]|nr:hypothetical protein F5Y10DRAFT_260743 [Nemania abortiva]